MSLQLCVYVCVRADFISAYRHLECAHCAPDFIKLALSEARHSTADSKTFPQMKSIYHENGPTF